MEEILKKLLEECFDASRKGKYGGCGFESTYESFEEWYKEIKFDLEFNPEYKKLFELMKGK